MDMENYMHKIQRDHLRIRNILQSGGTYLQVSGIPEVGDLTVVGYPHIYEQIGKGYPLEYVPLTNEILTQCGFGPEGQVVDGGRHIPGLILLEDNSRWHMRLDNMYITKTPIYFLHQLQNLYFAIMGKEMEFNPLGTGPFLQL